MDDAEKFAKSVLARLRRLAGRKPKGVQRRRNEAGQAIVEYVLLLALLVFFAKFIFFDPQYGFLGMLNKGMMRVGTALEQNLKSGTGTIPTPTNSEDPYAGMGSWQN